MSRELKDQIRSRVEPTEFADRLLEIATRIEREFEGLERKRLLELVHETLERHVEIREHTKQARKALTQLVADQQTLLQLFDFISAKPESEIMH